MALKKIKNRSVGGSLWRLMFIAAICGALNLWADDVPQSAPATNLPVPDASAQVTAEKKIRDAFPNSEKLPQDQRSATAVKMVDAAAGMTDDPAAMYVLLKKGGALGASAGDGDTSLKAASILGQSFAMDSDDLALEWLRKASSLQLPRDASRQLVDSILAFASTAAAKLKFDVMARALSAAEIAARNARDSSLRTLVLDRAAELKRVQSDSTRAKSAEAVLAKNPDDPEANYTLGRFLCLSLDDWKSGLPDLAKSSNSAYRQAASAELASPAETRKQAEVGDLWWDLGAKDVGRAKAALQRHAVEWYTKAKAAPDLNGLARIKIENRIHSFAASSETSTDKSGKWIDLMHLIDPKRDARGGTWKIENGVLISGHENGERIQIPYIPPEEYDYRIVFAMKETGTQVVQYASRGGREIIWDVGRNFNNVYTLNDKTIDRKFPGLHPGQKYSSLIKVRDGSVQFFLNGQLVLDEKDEDALFEKGLWYGLEDKRLLGVGSLFSPIGFFSIEVQEISGHGELVNSANSSPK